MNSNPKDFVKTKSVRLIIYFLALTGCLLFSNKSYASHIVGGEMTYVCLGDNEYEISLTVYRDCFLGTTFFDDTVSIGIFNNNDELVPSVGNGIAPGEIRILFSSFQDIGSIVSDSCLTLNNDICIQASTYKDTVILPVISGGYQLVYQRCCRNSQITNITNAANTGITLYSFISEESLTKCISSPEFNTVIPTVACINEPFEIDQSVSSASSFDSVTYSLCTPLTGASLDDPQPQPPTNPIPPEVDWNFPNFSYSNPLGGVPLSIDANGILTGAPNTTGLFVIGLCIESYLDGEVVSSLRRDIQISVGVCNNTVAKFETPAVECSELEIDFLNESLNADNFEWNFGDVNSPNNTSSAENPTHVFSDVGTYEVTLVAEPNSICSDTFTQTITIISSSEVEANFDYVILNCNNGLSLQLFDMSIAPPGESIVEWNWTYVGAQTSNAQNPTFGIIPGSNPIVMLEVTSSQGCVDVFQTVISNTTFSEDFMPTEFEICEGEQVVLNPNPLINPALKYRWTPPTTLMNPNSPSPTAFPNTTTVYTVEVENEITGCTREFDVTVNVINDIEIDINVSSTSCGGATTLFASTNISNPDFQWSDDPNFTNIISDSSNITISALGQTTYYVAVSSNGNCEAVDDITLIEQSVNVLLENTITMCLGTPETIELENLDPNDNLDISWTPSNGIVSGANSATVVINPSQPGQYFYYVNATNQFACEYFDSVLVSVIDPDEEPMISYTQDCGSGSYEVLITHEGNNFPYYFWEINQGNGTVDTLIGPAALYTFPAAGTYTLTLNPVPGIPCNLELKEFEIVVIEESIEAEFAWEYIDCYNDIEIQFKDASNAIQGNIVSWLWNFSSGDISIDENPILSLNSAQDLSVRLIVMTDLGCTDTIEQTIITSLTEIPLIENTIVLCDNQPVELYPNGSAAYDYSWTPSALLNNPNAVSPIADVSASQTFQVTITDASNNNCTIEESVEVIVPNQFLTAGLTFDYANCTPDSFTVVFSDASIQGAGDIVSYDWTFSDGQIATGNPVLVILSNIQTVDVELTVTDEHNCSSTITETIELQGINISLEEEIIKCAGVPVSLNPQGDPNLSYVWLPTTNLINGNTVPDPVANPIVTTTYIVTVTDGTCEAVDSITVIVPDIPLEPTFSFDVSDCINEAVIDFQDETEYTFSNIIEWNWTFSNGMTSTDQNPTITISQNTILEVELEVVTADGCIETTTEEIEINLIEIDLASQFVLCEPGGVFLNPNANLDQTYLWSPSTGLSDVNSPNPLAEPNQTINYVVEIFNGVCQVIETVTVVVPDVPLTPDFSYTIDDCTDVALIDFSDESVYSPGNIVEWEWQFSTGDSSSLQNPQLTLNQSQTLEVDLTVTTDDGCQASFFQTLDVDLIDINVQDSIISCSGEIVQLNPDGNTIYSYQWSPSTGLIGSPTSANPSANPASSTTYTVVVTAGACEITRTVDVIVPTVPLVTEFEYEFDDCTDNAIIEFTDLSQYSAAQIISWDWVITGNTTITSDVQNPIIPFTESDTVNVELTVTTADGCQGTFNQEIEINLIDINIDPTVVFCPSETLILNPNGNPTYTYQWSPAALLSDDDVPSPVVLGIFQNTTFTVTVSSGNCSLTRTTEVFFPDVPLQAAFNFAYNSCIDSSEITLYDQTLYSGTVVEWDWQVGSDTSTLQNPTFNYQQNQNLDVQLIVTSDQGCLDTVNTSIDVVVLDVNMPDSISSCNSEGVQLNPNGNPDWEYQWFPGTGINNDTTNYNPFVSGTSPINYTVTITDPAIGCSDTTSIFYNVSDTPLDAGFDVSLISCSDSTTIVLLDTSNYLGIIDEWSWIVDNGFISNQQNPVLIFHDPDTVSVQLTVNSNDGCTDSTTVELVVDIMEVGPIADTITLCEQTSVFLNPDGNPNLVYNWSPAATLDISNIPNPLATPDLGTTEYSVTITNPNNLECIDMRTVVVQVSEGSPEIIFPNGQDTTICGNTLEINGQSDLATNYLWSSTIDFQDTLSTSSTLTVTAVQATTYYFQAANEFGCADMDSITISNNGILIADPDDQILCLGDTSSIELFTPSGQLPGSDWQYEWTPVDEIISGENTSSIEVSPDETTTYDYLVFNNEGCEITGSVLVQVIDLEDFFSIETDRDSIDEGESTELSVADVPGVSYSWEPCDGTIDDCEIANPTVTPPFTSWYSVEVSDMVNGCFFRDSIRIAVRSLSNCEEPYIFVPKGFTPNDDGLNDILYVRGNAIAEMNFVVYNRWGEKVFESTDKDMGWDGKVNGKKLPPDVFGYYLSIKCVKGETFLKQGNVTLIR